MSPSTSHRPLLLRARADVTAAAVRVAGSPRWVVTDPVTLAHFDLSEQEFALLSELSTGSSLRDLQQMFERRFAPRRVSLDEVWQFLSRLHQAGLVVATGAGQGEQLLQRSAKEQRQKTVWAWTRLLAIKLPGVNPDGLLDATYPLVKNFFGPLAKLLALVLVGFALSILLVDFGQFSAGLPALAELATPGALAALVVTALLVKVLHELGHAFACRHFGGRVHEMGVLLLAFAPALYCDVSDLWRLPSKRKRMLVSAAGILVELVLASLAVIVWRYAEPGVVKLAALDVMIVCTVGTLAVNANPLLRYDGYYLLSDLTETPNLWQRSRQAVQTLWADWTMTRDQPRLPIQPWWLPLYGLASQAYMVVVMVSIVWVVSLTLRPYRLDAIAWMVGAIALATALVGPVRGLVQWAKNPLARRRTRRGRAASAVVLAMLLIAAAWYLPVRFSVTADAQLVLHQDKPVVTTIAGQLTESCQPGQWVEVGQVLARLKNPELEREVLRAQGELRQAQARVAQLEAVRARDARSNQQLPAAQAEVADREQRLEALRRESERLVLRAEVAGQVIAAPHRPAEPRQSLTLARWSGDPLDRQNLGAWLETGVEVCRLGNPQQLSARVLLEEDDIERVRGGQPVRLAWRQTPGEVIDGTVTEISQRVVVDPQQQGADAQRQRRYFALVQFDSPRLPLRVGGTGQARIDTGSTTLGPLLVTRLRQWFRLP